MNQGIEWVSTMSQPHQYFLPTYHIPVIPKSSKAKRIQVQLDSLIKHFFLTPNSHNGHTHIVIVFELGVFFVSKEESVMSYAPNVANPSLFLTEIKPFPEIKFHFANSSSIHLHLKTGSPHRRMEPLQTCSVTGKSPSTDEGLQIHNSSKSQDSFFPKPNRICSHTYTL